MKSEQLRNHITRTYIIMRWGMAILAILLPFILWLGGLVQGTPLQDSMSAYYHAGDGVMRDGFVGILFVISALLILYKGFTSIENMALNVAGVCLLGVAVFPMAWECGEACSAFSIHGIAAVSFFLVIAYVCLFRARDTLRLISDPAEVSKLKRIYGVLGFCMIVAPLSAFVVISIWQSNLVVFFVEAAGALVFAIYWIVKSREIESTDSERMAIEGRLHTKSYRARDIFSQIAIDPELEAQV